MTSKNFNRVLTVVVNKLNKCYFNFTKPENMKSVTIEKSTFLVEHELGLEIDVSDMFLYITVDGARMYEVDLDNEVKDSNELFSRVQYLLALAYGDVYNGNYDELVESEETEEIEDIIENEDLDEVLANEDLDETEEAAIETIPYVDTDCSNYMKVPKNSIYGMFGNMSLPCRVCTHFCTRTDTDNYTMGYCCRKNKENEKKAIKNPRWHHVSLNTLANIDFDMLDEKRQTYFTVYRDLQQTLSHLRKCKTVNTYSACYNRFVKRLNVMRGKSKITNAMYKYIEAKLSMQNVESGLWTSAWEAATGSHESRRYNKSRA